MAHNQDAIDSVGEMVTACMEAIALQFKTGVKITVVIRSPGFPDGSRDMVVTADRLPDVVAALQTQMAIEETTRQANARERIEEAMTGRGQ